MKISKQIAELLLALKGYPCSSAKVLLDGSINLGLGELIAAEEEAKKNRSYFEYEMGSYYKNWRIQSNGGQLDPCEVGVDYSGLAHLVASCLERQVISSVSYDEKHNEVTVNFRNSINLKFNSNVDVNDEIFHIRTSEFMYAELHSEFGWRCGDSRLPWPNNLS